MTIEDICQTIRQKMLMIYQMEKANREKVFHSGSLYILTHKIHYKNLDTRDYKCLIIFIQDEENMKYEYAFQLYDNYFDDQDEPVEHFMRLTVKTSTGKTERTYAINERELPKYIKLAKRIKAQDIEDLIVCLNTVLLADS